jgi:cobalt-zinc-cadmium efflux system membrane fusion protein
LPARLGRLSRYAFPIGALIVVALVAAFVKGRSGLSGWLPGVAAVRQADMEPAPAAKDPHTLAVSEKIARNMAGMQFATIESRAVSSELTCNGSVSFNENRYAQIRPRVDGILRHIRLDVGAVVHAGDELAIVDSATLGEYKASFVYAVVNVKYTETYCERLRRLAEQQAIPSKTLFEMEHMLQEQQLDVARARQKLVNLGFTPDQIDKFVADNDTHAELTITAPWDGVLVQRHAVEGEAVSGSVPVFAIADLGTMWVQLSVYESDLRRIHLDQPLTFVPDGLPDQSFAGKVTWISPEVDAQTRTIRVRGEVSNAGGALRSNMFGKGRLVVQSSRDSLVVPPEAVQVYGDRNVVFVPKDPQHFDVRNVEIGIKGADYWEVKSGLSAGEQVVTTGSFLLKSNLENDAFGKVE